MGLDRSDSQNCIGVGQLSIEVRGFHERDIYIYICIIPGHRGTIKIAYVIGNA